MNGKVSPTEVTAEQLEAIRDYFATHELSTGLGTEDKPCTIAAINLQLTGRLTNELHPCMSPVIRSFVVALQDRMTHEVRNSVAWKKAAVGIAGSVDPAREGERLGMIINGKQT